MSKVLMHGPAFDGSGKLVNREVTEGDVGAFKAAGYELGGLPSVPDELPVLDDETHEDGTPKVTYTEADAAEQAEVKPKGKRK